jgi:flagellar L-ring protein precursor FlgH
MALERKKPAEKRAIKERGEYKCLAAKNGNDIKSPPTRGRRSSGKTGTRRSRFYFLLVLCFLLAGRMYGDSLWSPDFNGYLIGEDRIAVGDIVGVTIDSDLSLSFRASSKDSKNLTLEFSGGDFGNLLSFLPTVSSQGNLSAQGAEQYSLKTVMVARVTEIDPTGLAFVQGSRSVGLQGKEETISVSGWISPEDLGTDRVVPFSKIADARIVFQSLLEPGQDTLLPEDIEQIIEEILVDTGVAVPGAVAPGAAAPGAVAPEAVAAAPVETETRVSYRLTDEKRLELFLSLVNRLIDLLFQ